MCGRYVSATSPQQIADYFGAATVSESLSEPNYNVAPTSNVPVIRDHAGGRSVDALRWGLLPFWAKSANMGAKMINARSETAAEKSAFKRALTKRRCIIPADAFYEWTTVPNPAGKGKPIKQPWCIERVDEAPFAFAGLWETWRGPERDGEPIYTCTILTREPNTAMAKLHDRMPVLVPPDRWDLWLDADYEDGAHALAELPPAPSELLHIYAVSTAVNNSRSSGPALMDPVDPVASSAAVAVQKSLL